MKKVYLKAYLENNLGDDLFVYIFDKRYKTKNIIFSNNKVTSQIGNTKVLSNSLLTNFNKFLKAITFKNLCIENILKRNCDLLVHIGGSIFIEKNEDDLEMWKKCFNWYYKKPQIPYYIIGCNFGPYKSKKFVNLIEQNAIKNAEDVCFRDNKSYEIFKNNNNVRKAADIVFSLDVSPYKKQKNKNVIFSVINLSNRKDISNKKNIYENKIIEMIKHYENQGYSITLMSFCKKEGDEETIKSILNQYSSPNIDTYFYDGNIEEALQKIADCDIIIGSRFHANILGILFEKDIIPIAYSDKIINTLSDMNFKEDIIDIRKIDNFDVNTLKKRKNKYSCDLNFYKKNAERHFEKLDKVLERR